MKAITKTVSPTATVPCITRMARYIEANSRMISLRTTVPSLMAPTATLIRVATRYYFPSSSFGVIVLIIYDVVQKGKRNGKGMLKGAKGFTYTGEFKDGNMHGKGDYRYSSGDRYVGTIKNELCLLCSKLN